jgi:hypothetical protein
MLEAIKVAIELLSKSINPSTISEWRRKEKLQEIGGKTLSSIYDAQRSTYYRRRYP